MHLIMPSVNGLLLAEGNRNVNLEAEVSPRPIHFYDMFNISHACSANNPILSKTVNCVALKGYKLMC